MLDAVSSVISLCLSTISLLRFILTIGTQSKIEIHDKPDTSSCAYRPRCHRIAFSGTCGFGALTFCLSVTGWKQKVEAAAAANIDTCHSLVRYISTAAPVLTNDLEFPANRFCSLSGSISCVPVPRLLFGLFPSPNKHLALELFQLA